MPKMNDPKNENQNKNVKEKVKKSKSFNKDMALFDPASLFITPMDIVNSKKLTRQEKLQALTNWELECRLLEMADDENMPMLKKDRKVQVNTEDVHKAREQLGDDDSGAHAGTTKIGM